MRTTAALVLAAALLVAALPATAHQRGRSQSFWKLDARGAQVRLQISELDLSRIPPQALAPGASALGEHLAATLVLRSAAGACARQAAPRSRSGQAGIRVFEWRLDCPEGAPSRIESALLKQEAPSHLHFARIETLEGEVVEVLLAGAERSVTLSAPGSAQLAGTSWTGYLALGVEHIATGWDHLAFVVALLLLARRVTELFALVSAFTVAHSVTLGLAVLGVVRPEIAAVEALIGFSVLLVAAENAWLLGGRGRALPLSLAGGLLVLACFAPGVVSPLCWLGLALFTGCHFALLERSADPGALRAAVAFGFGLVHGFGFAGVMAELELPGERLAAALLGFNLGVEVGQLVVVAALWPVLRLLARGAGAPALRRAEVLGSAAIAGLGSYWLLDRIFA